MVHVLSYMPGAQDGSDVILSVALRREESHRFF